MKITINYKGKMVEKEIPDAELEELVAEKKRTGHERSGYERSAGEGYYYASNPFNPKRYSQEFEAGTDDDDNAFSSADYYTDECVARDNARADTLMRKLRRYAAENGGIPSVENWGPGTKKWSITYEAAQKKITAYYSEVSRSFGQIYFLSEKACKASIEQFRDELLWYFTEYDPQLR